MSVAEMDGVEKILPLDHKTAFERDWSGAWQGTFLIALDFSKLVSQGPTGES